VDFGCGDKELMDFIVGKKRKVLRQVKKKKKIRRGRVGGVFQKKKKGEFFHGRERGERGMPWGPRKVRTKSSEQKKKGLGC